ncbi:MAG: hypothetical protein WCG80_19260 [Spirochaetales bacterium]
MKRKTHPIAIHPLESEPEPWPSTPLIFDRFDLRKRGWSLTLIRRHLDHCEFRVPSGYYADKCCYPAGDVITAESTAAFKAGLAVTQARKAAARCPRILRCLKILDWGPRLRLIDFPPITPGDSSETGGEQ